MSSSILPDSFQLSQSSLQDFVDCPRRFLLRHVEKRAYPAAEAEPIRLNELRRERGIQFHKMICQEQSGVSRERIDEQCATDEALREWWENYKTCDPAGAQSESYAEITLQGRVAGYPLVATYDLIVKRPGGTLEIFDWKTSRRRPTRDRLTGRLQTKVYPYLLVEAGRWLNGGEAPDPEQVRMTYWFSGHPHDPETFKYNVLQYRCDKEALEGHVEAITSRQTRGDFEKASDETYCRYCTYRSYCGRGVVAGRVDDDGDGFLDDTAFGDSGLLESTLDDIEEIAF